MFPAWRFSTTAFTRLTAAMLVPAVIASRLTIRLWFNSEASGSDWSLRANTALNDLDCFAHEVQSAPSTAIPAPSPNGGQ